MTITVAEFKQRFARDVDSMLDRSTLPPGDIDRLKEEILNLLIDEKVMLLRARELAVSVSDAELAKAIADVKESYAAAAGGLGKVIARAMSTMVSGRKS